MLSFSGRKFKEVFELYNVDKVLYFEEMFLGMDVDGDGSYQTKWTWPGMWGFHDPWGRGWREAA